MTTMINSSRAHPRRETVEERLRRVLSVHFDAQSGTPYWLARAAELGIDPRREVHCLSDLSIFGEMTPADLRRRPLRDHVPRRFHERLEGFILGQTGGTTGEGVWTAYREDEFTEAFVLPFEVAAGHVGFPRRGRWLYIGPTGPHIIGKVVRHLARAVGSGDPFSVDFDPRWVRKLPEGSFARDRYTQHIIEQAMSVVANQEIDVLFTTPVLLERLAPAMTAAQRRHIRGVHYGGMSVSAQDMERFQIELFPRAVHLSGYGNTLFGCCLELTASESRAIDYFPFGARLLLEIVDDNGAPVATGENGAVRFTRLDESMLIIGMRERDEASSAPVPTGAPAGFALPGVRDPRPRPSATPRAAAGLY